jgi:Domain of unknown function (DUF1707)/2TM domain
LALSKEPAMDRDQGDQQRASMRASDADRERFVEALRQHHADGRLTTEELTERNERAYATRTFGDLDALAVDLPPVGPPAPRPAPPAPGGSPGYSGPPPAGRPPAGTRPEARTALYRSILWFGSLTVFMIIVWGMTNFGGYFWPIWPILGFAIAIGWQVFNVYGPRPPDQRRP